MHIGVVAAVAQAVIRARRRSPGFPTNVTRGKISAIAMPTRAVAPASWRSAMRMSGRRRSRSAGSPTAVIVGSGGRSVAGASSARSAPGSRPDQHAQAMDRARHRGFERPDRAECARQLRLRARRVELRAAAGIEQYLARAPACRLLVRDVAARHVELLLEATQLEVGTGHFGGHADLRIVQRRPRRRRARHCWLRCRDARGRRSRAPRPRRSRRRSSRDSRDTPGADCAARVRVFGVAAAGGDASARDRDALSRAQCARFLDARERDAQVVSWRAATRSPAASASASSKVCQNSATPASV